MMTLMAQMEEKAHQPMATPMVNKTIEDRVVAP
jgi:hypothetical protein